MSRRQTPRPRRERAAGGEARPGPLPESRGGSRAPAVADPQGGRPRTPPALGRPLGERLRAAAFPAGALLPIRFFFGLTFLYAGFDKLASPSFFDAASPTSIQAQLQDFTRFSPIGALVKVGEPFAVPLGILIALAEVGIGIGALTGLAFRLAAAGGATLSFLFWLTASWGTHPFYYGADLPYAAGWVVLALAGHGNVLVPARLTAIEPELSPEEAAARRRRARRGEPVPGATSPERRALLQTGLLAAIAVVASSLAAPLRGFAGLGVDEGRSVARQPAPGSTPAPSPGGSAGSSPSPGASQPATGGLVIATIAAVEQQTALPFTVPFDAPSPLPAGDPAVIVRLQDGSFVAYDAVCTHQGCTVEWDARDGVLLCPCHGAAFDVNNRAAVLQGPTRQPLPSIPIVADQASGTIKLRV